MTPAVYRPQLATLAQEAPEGDRWLHELKYDGYRIGCLIAPEAVTLVSRNGNDWTAQFPEIAAAARMLKVSDALLDGEVCALLPDGRTSFMAMQGLAPAQRARLVYFVFDLLCLNGKDIAALPLEERKERLRRVLGRAHATSRLQYVHHVIGNGTAVLREARRMKVEGIVSKLRGQPHAEGRRGDGWVKTKIVQSQEFVVGGFTDPGDGARDDIGAVFVGYYDDEERLVFAGKVGSGWTDRTAVDLRRQLAALEQKECPFQANGPSVTLGRHAHWVRPEIVCDVMYLEWTRNGYIRQPSFQAIRRDLEPRSVRRETPDGAAL